MTQPARAAELDAVYRAQRLRLSAAVAARTAAIWTQLQGDQPAALAQLIPVVEAGQSHVASLVAAYMTAKASEQGAQAVLTVDPARYTTEALRGLPAAEVYSRPWGAFYKNLDAGVTRPQATQSALASLDKLVRTDMQLAQTHSARDLMSNPEVGIVGWRRVLNGDTNCPLCTVASTRTYRIGDLMPIHEHCDCTVEPLWGTEPVTSVGTTVKVELDPELGPRLMASGWSSVGPRLL